MIIFLFIALVILITFVIVLYLIFKNKSTFVHSTDQVSCKAPTETTNIIKSYFDKNPMTGFIDPTTFQKIVASAKSENLALLAIADYSAKFSTHAVMSKYPVGACVLGVSGKVYIGANFEFFGTLISTIHGEQCAVHNAAVHKEKALTKLAVNEAPCGLCRQYLIDLGLPKNLTVIFCSADENGYLISDTLENLLPHNFGPENLHLDVSTLVHKSWELEDEPSGCKNDEATQLATSMLVQSYAPYTQLPAGAVLVFNCANSSSHDDMVPGQTVENAAYNPTVSCIRGAFSLSGVVGKSIKDLKRVVIVDSEADDNLERRDMFQALVDTLSSPNTQVIFEYSVRKLKVTPTVTMMAQAVDTIPLPL